MPESEKSYDLSKTFALNEIETSRITKEGIISHYLADKKLGMVRDSRIDEYESLKPLNFSDIKNFHSKNFSGKAYNYCIVASEKKINPADLSKLGQFTKLSLTQIFGY